MRESWIVRNNTGGPLYLPENKLRFNKARQEKDLVFFTGKSIADLERDEEIIANFASQNIVTVELIKEGQVNSEQIEKLREEIKNQDIRSEIEELKEILRNSQLNQRQDTPQQPVIDIDELVKKISSSVSSALPKYSDDEQKKSYSNDEDKLREQALEKLIFDTKEKENKSFKELGKEKQVEDEAAGNEDLLEF